MPFTLRRYALTALPRGSLLIARSTLLVRWSNTLGVLLSLVLAEYFLLVVMVRGFRNEVRLDEQGII